MRAAAALALLLTAVPSGYAQLMISSNSSFEVNHQTTSQNACSHGDKEWYICTQPDGWGAMFYCPAYSDFNETELATVEWGGLGVPTPLTPCFTCPAEGSSCNETNAEVMTAAGIPEDAVTALGGWDVWADNVYYCEQLCELNKPGEACSRDDPCINGRAFCDYDPADVVDFDNATEGICRQCPDDPLAMCHEEGLIETREGQINCQTCSLGCYGAAASKLFVDGEPILSHPIDGSKQDIHQNATGALHDCTVLTLDPKNICPGAEGKICVVHFKVQFALIWQVSNQAEKSGCAGVIAFYPGEYESPYYHSNSELHIPYILVSDEDGTSFLNNIGATATIEVDVFGGACYPPDNADVCTAQWPCGPGDFCEYQSGPIENEGSAITFLYTSGTCIPCPMDVDTGEYNPLGCYFDSRYDGRTDAVETLSTKTVQKVQECAATCGAVLTSNNCKFCTSEVTAFEFGVENEDDRCIFCPAYDMQYPERIVPLFGENVKCWQLESFFNKLPVPKKSRNCELSLTMNFICGCEGSGYAGAGTTTKQKALVWMPRVSAILSMLGSLFIIVDTQRTRLKRSKLINKILCTISVFDFVGSFAMAFASLPTPEEDYVYGAKGNDATCKVQGFFIQMGTIACFLGVSLSVYYNITIKQGWSENKMRRRKMAYFLLVPPIIIGFVYAGIGIPYYDNVMVWCNNSAKWWPEVPVILAILYSTIIMGDVTYSVYKKESASSRYSGGGNKLSKMVFKQAVFFVGAFYFTWVPYLTLQFLLSSGTGFEIYGLFLAAATMVPLQGFWNFFVYARPRYFNKGKGLSLFKSARFGSLRKSTKSGGTSDVGNSTNGSSKAKNPFSSGFNTSSSAANKSSTVKSSVAHTSSVAMESEVVPFGANEDEPEVVPFGASDPNDDEDEPEVVPFGASDPNADEDEPQVVPFGASDPTPNSDEDDARYEMLLAG